MDILANKYKKLDPREHVLARPGMYIGSIDEDIYETWVLNAVDQMAKEKIRFNAGLFKIFDEILVNAIDHSIRVPDCKNIKVSIKGDAFEVMNDGEGIEIAIHPEHNIYIPQLIFGNMLTSTNYDDTEEKIIGGLNGLGAKVCNIFSEYFEIETVDSVRKLHYIQRFEKNMSVVNPPIIKKYSKKPFTTIRFRPDYTKIGSKVLSADMLSVIKKRVYDACAVTQPNINIYLNDDKLDYKTFDKYASLFIPHGHIYEKINERWEIVASYNESNGFEQMSFVNGIWTIRGGKHVDYILNQIIKKLTEAINKKHKTLTIKPQVIRDNLFLMVKSTIVNPMFDSQSKETLTTPVAKFGSKAEVSDKFITKLLKSGILEKITLMSQAGDLKSLKKTDGKKQNIIRGLPKLEDANWAGGPKANQCTLILTEGDSASSMAIAGLSEIGRDKYGVFPLKGKVMNVKDVNSQKIADNEEISNIKKILGLEVGKDYKDLNDLRYGGVMLLTDQDCDGSHIKGLIMNLFHTMWPSLTKNLEFIHCMQTPIVKIRKRNEVKSFYSLTDFENWQKEGISGWDIKYYKGLGTSTETEAKEYFKNMQKVTYKFTEKSHASLELAFNKSQANERKEWLSEYNRQDILDYKNSEVTYEDFVNKELIHFSNYDVERSIPSMVDGLKISQRKILYSCFKRNLTDKEIRVAQLAAYVSENSAYHHGEASLLGAIINMAQDFVGSNNINLLFPSGMYGSRLHGGKDSAQPRYIHTLLTDVATTIFKKQDTCIIKYLDDDGIGIEPEHYIPILPYLLVNGSIGIGTGFSTTIPSYNPLDIVGLLKRMLSGEEVSSATDDLNPWCKGFNGEIRKIGTKRYSIGKFSKLSATKIEITELPIGYWTFDFKADLEKLMDKHPEFKKYENYSAGDVVHFVLHFTSSAAVEKFLEVESNGFTRFENTFGLLSTKGMSTSNMYAFNASGNIKKYDTAFDIVKEFYNIRLGYYIKRKAYILNKLQYDANLLANKIRFIKEVVNETIQVHKMKKIDLEQYLETNMYLKHENTYDYIIRIPVYNLTIDKVEELENEITKAESEIKDLTAKEPQTIWIDELVEFEKVYEKFTTKNTTKTIKKTVKKIDKVT